MFFSLSIMLLKFKKMKNKFKKIKFFIIEFNPACELLFFIDVV